ncbi:hypothetical protein KC324_g71 [Hortaea werneckii]|nr:hypothetical protein KC324_g71 [Hortaea werneckii]
MARTLASIVEVTTRSSDDERCNSSSETSSKRRSSQRPVNSRFGIVLTEVDKWPEDVVLSHRDRRGVVTIRSVIDGGHKVPSNAQMGRRGPGEADLKKRIRARKFSRSSRKVGTATEDVCLPRALHNETIWQSTLRIYNSRHHVALLPTRRSPPPLRNLPVLPTIHYRRSISDPWQSTEAAPAEAAAPTNPKIAGIQTWSQH